MLHGYFWNGELITFQHYSNHVSSSLARMLVSEPDYYVTLCLPTATASAFSTRTVNNNINPEWNETFTFRVPSHLKVSPPKSNRHGMKGVVFIMKSYSSGWCFVLRFLKAVYNVQAWHVQQKKKIERLQTVKNKIVQCFCRMF